MKIGIITEFSKSTTNYGNILQTYALNHYLRSAYPTFTVQTVLFNPCKPFGWISISLIKRFISSILKTFRRLIKQKKISEVHSIFFKDFAKDNISFSTQVSSEKELTQIKYDILIVGSDVVWSQVDGYINTVKFLTFKGSRDSIKISYAASFGRNHIPDCNKKIISKSLSKFKGISVREKSSIALLKEIGIQNAVHVADPTLLLTIDAWNTIEQNPYINGIQSGQYILLYRISPADWHKTAVKKIQDQFNKKILDLQETKSVDSENEEVITPQKWLWLIHNSGAVITDSFHCMIFSSIFHKPFFVIEREYKSDINNRMIDFLEFVKHQHLFISRDLVEPNPSQYKWDYKTIEKQTNELVIKSKLFFFFLIPDELKTQIK